MVKEVRASTLSQEYKEAQRSTNYTRSVQAHSAARASGITVEVIYDHKSYLEQRSHANGVCRLPMVFSKMEAREVKDPLVTMDRNVYGSKIREFHIQEQGGKHHDFYFAFSEELDKTVGRAFDFMNDEVNRSDIEAGTLRINLRLAEAHIQHLEHQIEDYSAFNTKLQRDIVQVCQAGLWERIKYLFTGHIRSLRT